MPSDDESDNDYRQRSRTHPSETFSHEEGYYQRRKRKSPSPRGLGSDAISKALDQLSKSPFTRHIEGATLPRRFKQLAFTLYNDNTDPVEMYNEMNGNFDDVFINTFKNNLPVEHGLRKSLTVKPATSVRQLMDRIDKYKRVEEDRLYGKGKEKVIPQKRKDSRSNRYNSNRPMRDFVGQSGATNTQAINTVFQEPVHRVLEKIKNEPYFKWPNKMAGESTRCNQNFYCQYHQDHGHTTENCRNLWNYLD